MEIRPNFGIHHWVGDRAKNLSEVLSGTWNGGTFTTYAPNCNIKEVGRVHFIDISDVNTAKPYGLRLKKHFENHHHNFGDESLPMNTDLKFFGYSVGKYGKQSFFVYDGQNMTAVLFYLFSCLQGNLNALQGFRYLDLIHDINSEGEEI